jgi:type VI secretion system protein ImpC
MSGSLAQVDALLKQFNTHGNLNGCTPQQALCTLAQQALAAPQPISADPVACVTEMIAAIDAKLANVVNEIIHHESYQKLESAWRGLHYLVSTDPDKIIKIRVFDISKEELSTVLQYFKGDTWSESPVFFKIHEQEYGTYEGHPYSLIIGDYYFDHGESDVELLTEMAKIADATHAVFIAGANPSLLGLSTWQELPSIDVSRHPLDVFLGPEYASWHLLRKSEEAKSLALCLPRFLARTPYGKNSNLTEAFDFEEDVTGYQDKKYVWSNAAYLMAANIGRSYREYGWFAQIQGTEDGSIKNLPMGTLLPYTGALAIKVGPTEVAIDASNELMLSTAGLSPLVQQFEDQAVFNSARSLNEPAQYDDPAVTDTAKRAAMLPYQLGCCLFARYIKCMVRDRASAFMKRANLEDWLNRWIKEYVENGLKPELERAFPLANAQIVIKEVDDNPYYYDLLIFLEPRYQLRRTAAPICIKSRLPRPPVFDLN